MLASVFPEIDARDQNEKNGRALPFVCHHKVNYGCHVRVMDANLHFHLHHKIDNYLLPEYGKQTSIL